MPNITQSEILAAIEAIVSGVADVGLVLTRERFVESDKELLNLFANLNSGVAKGWLIAYSGFSQLRGDAPGEVIRTLKFKLLSLYPYEDSRSDGNTSHTKFWEMVEAVNTAIILESNWNLGLDNRLQHSLLQSDGEGEFSVSRYGEGAGSKLLHHGIFTLEVEVIINVC